MASLIGQDHPTMACFVSFSIGQVCIDQTEDNKVAQRNLAHFGDVVLSLKSLDPM